jgi:predicted nucleic acid-binding protein
VSVLFLETSPLARVLLREPDRYTILRAIAGFELVAASRLLRTELQRVALRADRQHDAEMLLAGISLLPVDDTVLHAVETLPPTGVGTLDAIHLATALRLATAVQLDAFMTYDQRLADGARHHGLTVLAPA